MLYEEYHALKETYLAALRKREKAVKDAGVDELLEQFINGVEADIKAKEKELRASRMTFDKVYRARYLDAMSVVKIAKTLNMSEPSIYRILRKIEKSVKVDNF